VDALVELARLDENLAAASLELTDDDVRELDDVTATFAVHGGRGTGQEQYG
jgi:diketogulonate reductase-like aldo/keto reductase